MELLEAMKKLDFYYRAINCTQLNQYSTGYENDRKRRQKHPYDK